MADRCLFGYLALQLLLQMSVASFTGIARYAIYSVTDVFLPYYVASRGLRDLRAFRDVVMTLVLAVVVMAPVAVFEYFRHWLLYSGLSASMGTLLQNIENNPMQCRQSTYLWYYNTFVAPRRELTSRTSMFLLCS